MTRSRLVLVALVIVVALVIGGYVAYDQVLRGDSVSALALPSANASAAPAASTGASSAGAPSAAAGSSSAAGSAASQTLAGTWNVASGSQAGYRVREQLANLPAESDAVGGQTR